jgi:hypothetical protein
MRTIYGFILGLLGGAAGTVAWLLSEPASGAGTSPQSRWNELKARFARSVEEGKAAGGETEERLREDLDARRHGSVKR